MTAAIEAAGTNTNTGTGNSASVSISGATSGELLIFFVTHNDNNNPITGPSGWTTYLNRSSGGSISGVFYKTSDGTETTVAATWEFSKTWATAILRVSGHNGLDDTADSDSIASTHSVENVTTTEDDCLVLGCLLLDGTASAYPSGMTAEIAEETGADQIHVSYATQATLGTTSGLGSWTSGFAYAIIATLSIKPAAGGSSVPIFRRRRMGY